MSNCGSVTEWIVELRAGDEVAGANLWSRYIQKLVRLAYRQIRQIPRRIADEEDIAIEAFHAFFLGLQNGRFGELNNRDDLWQILVMLTERKAVDHVRRSATAKRGNGLVRGESVFFEDPMAAEVVADEPTPEFAALVQEEFRCLLERLDDEQLRRIAIARMEGYTNVEIAKQIGRSVSSVERKLARIRAIWQAERA